MTPDVVFVVLFGALSTAAYGLWCLERLPRTRRWFVVVSVVCLGVGVYFHNYVLPARALLPTGGPP